MRFAASKLAEGDALIMEKLNLSANEQEMVEHIIIQMEEERGLDRAAAIRRKKLLFSCGGDCSHCRMNCKDRKE